MDEKKFFEKLGITPGKWFASKAGLSFFPLCIATEKNNETICLIPWRMKHNKTVDMMAASKQMFLKLFYACENYYNFIQTEEDEEFFDCISEPLTLATGKPWEEIEAIAKDCGL